MLDIIGTCVKMFLDGHTRFLPFYFFTHASNISPAAKHYYTCENHFTRSKLCCL